MSKRAPKTVDDSIQDRRYETFLAGLKLISIGQKQSAASLDRQALSATYREGAKPIRNFRDEYEVTALGKDFFEASGTYQVTVRATEEREPALKIECTYEVHFHQPKDTPKSLIERFVESELQLLLIPYARQFFWTITGQMSIPPFVVPLSIGVWSNGTESKRSAKVKS